MVDYDAAVAAVQDPNADPILLAKIAYENPEFGANVAVNPRCYPGLKRWIAEFGDDRARETLAQYGFTAEAFGGPVQDQKATAQAAQQPAEQQVRLLRCLGRERGGEHGAVPILDVVFGGVRCGVCRSGGSGLSGGGRGGRLCGKSGIGCRFRGTGLPVVVLRFGCANCGIRGAFHRIVRIPTQFRCWRVGKFGHDDAVLSLTGSQSGVDCRVAELAQPFDQCRIGVGITCDAGA